LIAILISIASSDKVIIEIDDANLKFGKLKNEICTAF